ncbi:MAG: PCP reductase family protein, partial [Myxococcota bacterium]
MKFLCVTCDEAMKLTDAKPPDRGSLTVVYRCPGCAHEIAMLTNPYETQVVGSLGVRVGPEADGAAKCPFPGVMEEMGVSLNGASAAFPWTSEAVDRLANIPEFARPMAKT